MNQFVVIDFETANPSRVSACALGYTIVEDSVIVESNGFLIKPVGGHAPFQTKIHGINERDTADKWDFRSAYSSVEHLFEFPIVGHSLFDKQVLKALSDHFKLRIRLEYTDSVAGSIPAGDACKTRSCFPVFIFTSLQAGFGQRATLRRRPTSRPLMCPLND